MNVLTNTSLVRIVENEGILECTFKVKRLDAELGKEAMASRLRLVRYMYSPVLADLSQLQAISKDARDLLGGPPAFVGIKALALFYTNPVNRMIASLFLGTASSDVPVQLFDDREEALRWLLSFQKKGESYD